MILRLLGPAAVVSLLVPLAACGGSDAAVARDGSSAQPDGPPALALPADVRTANLATVMDTGKGKPEICLGPIAESYPPQCGGPTLLRWKWKEHPEHERQGRIRWGSFMVTGSWDGRRLSAVDAIPAALYDPMYVEPTEPPAPQPPVSQEELDRIAEELLEVLPGVQGTYATETYVMADVLYDDGSLQAWADEEYGEDVVVLTAAMVPVEG